MTKPKEDPLVQFIAGLKEIRRAVRLMVLVQVAMIILVILILLRTFELL